MNKNDYCLSGDEKRVLSKNIGEVILKMRAEKFSVQEFRELAQLLQVNQEGFEKCKAETWFKKSWLVISGDQGKLKDVCINNLGKIQLGVLKLLGEILEDSSGIKNDLLTVFGCLKRIQVQSLELQSIILMFNQKYDKQFHELQKTIQETHGALRILQIALGFVFIGGAVLLFVPGLREQYWQYGVAAGGVIGFFFLGQFYISFSKTKRMIIPVKIRKNSDTSLRDPQAIVKSCKFIESAAIADEEPSVENRETCQTGGSVELTDLAINTGLPIAQDEERGFRHQNIVLNTSNCRGRDKANTDANVSVSVKPMKKPSKGVKIGVGIVAAIATVALGLLATGIAVLTASGDRKTEKKSQ
jgi:hypothetical protein